MTVFENNLEMVPKEQAITLPLFSSLLYSSIITVTVVVSRSFIQKQIFVEKSYNQINIYDD